MSSKREAFAVPRTLYNAPRDYVEEALAGMVASYPQHYRFSSSDPRVIVAAARAAGRKVGVISLGGFGHLPVFAGYVGPGLLDACAVGNVFASPSAAQIVNAAREADHGHGVVAVVGNYGGDTMNTKLATALLASEGIALETVLVTDDVASAQQFERENRRGVAGLVLAVKIAGAAADRGGSVEEVAATAIAAMENCRSFGVALSPCVVPTAGRATFTVAPDEMDLGMGIHGEPGILRRARAGADEVVDFLLDRILEDRGDERPGQVALLVNSLGATPHEELFIMAKHAFARLAEEGVGVGWCEVGRYATSMEMAGASITLLDASAAILELLKAPATCPFWSVA